MMRSSPDPGHVRDQSSASAARPAVSCSTTPYLPSASDKSTPAEVWALLFGGADRSASCLPVPSHRGPGRGLLSAHPPSHSATVSSADAVPGLVAEWLPVGGLPPRPRHRRPVSGRTGEGLQRPSQSRVGDSSCTGAVHCTEPYCRRGHKTQPAQPASVLVGQGQEDSSLGSVLVGWSASAGPGNHVHFPPSAPTSRGTTQRARGCQPRACLPQQARTAIRWSQTPPSQSAVPVPGPGTNGTEPSAHRIARSHALHHLNRRRVLLSRPRLTWPWPAG